MPLTVAIIGAGPSGFYTAEALLEQTEDIRIDIIERLPTPFGLIRAGVAPDHQSTKQVAKRFEKSVLRDLVHFYGNVEIGNVPRLADLCGFYDAVVLAVGAGLDRPLGIRGEQLPGVYGSASFVGWYNAHPDFRDLAPRLATNSAVVIGNGNVALDVARVLVKSNDEMASSDLPDYAGEAIRASGISDVHVVGRRGPAEARFTSAELREIGFLSECVPVVDEGDLPESVKAKDERHRRIAQKNVAILRGFAQSLPVVLRPKRLHFRFHLAPVEIEGVEAVRAVRFEKTQMRGDAVVGTGVFERIDCGLVAAAVGYRSNPIPGVLFDDDRGLYTNTDGRIAKGVYAVGWAKRGPTGVIASNRPDAELCARQIMADCAGARHKPGRLAFEPYLRARGIRTITFDDWRKIDAAEIAGAIQPAPRRKLTTLSEMLELLAESGQRAAV